MSRGIEVGHAFLLGTKYSEALGAKFLDPQGKQQPVVMGCYGIGVTRTLQAVIEVHQDKEGIRWPAAVSPYTVMLVTLDLADPAVKEATDRLVDSLEKAGIDYLWDDRDERPGVKFKDADLLMERLGVVGIPSRSPSGLARGIGFLGSTAILGRFAILYLRTVSTVEFQSVVFWISGSGVDGG